MSRVEKPTAETSSGPPATPAPNVRRARARLVAAAAAIVALGASGGAAAWYFLPRDAGESPPRQAAPKAPTFVQLDPFTVNLKPEGGEHYLQVSLTLQVARQADADLLKVYMPQVRSRLLLLLSSKRATDLLDTAGKERLKEEISAHVSQPLLPQANPIAVSGVFYTSFVIQ
jgi:flagellar protein FliL